MQEIAQEPIEPGEMVHVRVRDEHVADEQELAARQRAKLTEIEQQGAAAELEGDEQSRIRERLAHQSRPHQPGHPSSSSWPGGHLAQPAPVLLMQGLTPRKVS